MKQRRDVPLAEVLAVLDARIAATRGKQQYLREHRSPKEPSGWRERKRRELRLERLQLEGLRRSLSSLRYGPRRDWRREWSQFVRSVCQPVV